MHKSDPSRNVINLSKHSFSLDTLKFFNNNLNFVPIPNKYNKKELDTEAGFFSPYQTSISLSNIDQGNLTFQIKYLKKWTPKDNYYNVSTFIDFVQNDLSKTQNLSKGEQKAMKDLVKRKDIIITNADKGGAVVILDVEKYINEAICQLSDKRN